MTTTVNINKKREKSKICIEILFKDDHPIW